ncbi:MAG: FAD-dependent monooxygenase [Hyphomicrobiales bacterium]|nr:FAD-dependent monooxygenase [Hyphomicrobiales bacterium]
MDVAAERCEVVIGGAGFAGLALAIALRQSLGPGFGVAVVDPALGRLVADARSSAIVAAARRLFETLGVWPRIEAQPILDMVVTDSRLRDVVRPTFLTFAGELEPGEPFAHMVENGPLLAALMEKAQQEGVHLLPTSVLDFAMVSPPPGGGRSTAEGGRVEVGVAPNEGRPRSDGVTPPRLAARADPPLPGEGEPRAWGRERQAASQAIEIRLADGASLSARLLVAADGARSVIRKGAGIATHGWDYGQSAIVATIAHEREHHGRAEEHFLPAGPFAILPLTGRRSSIVWTETTREAERIVALPDDQFHAELERRFGLHLGEISVAGPRRVHPLGLKVARTFIADRLALVGDAAHVIHPIAGQGLNMGLKDVAALAEVVVDAVRLGLDPGSLAVLERYQRWRRFDTMAMGVATDGLNRLFSNQSDVLRLARDIGLGLVERMPALKRFFIREAAGLTGEVPKLLRGEAL